MTIKLDKVPALIEAVRGYLQCTDVLRQGLSMRERQEMLNKRVVALLRLEDALREVVDSE
jgi:hypothetical protein